jgi:hypothetical protein
MPKVTGAVCMIHFIIRRSEDKEPLALVRLNANGSGNMTIMPPITHPRFGVMAPIHRGGRHTFNLMIGDNKEVEDALTPIKVKHSKFTTKGYQLEQTSQAEWETFVAFDLFPVLKLAMAK